MTFSGFSDRLDRFLIPYRTCPLQVKVIIGSFTYIQGITECFNSDNQVVTIRILRMALPFSKKGCIDSNGCENSNLFCHKLPSGEKWQFCKKEVLSREGGMYCVAHSTFEKWVLLTNPCIMQSIEFCSKILHNFAIFCGQRSSFFSKYVVGKKPLLMRERIKKKRSFFFKKASSSLVLFKLLLKMSTICPFKHLNPCVKKWGLLRKKCF